MSCRYQKIYIFINLSKINFHCLIYLLKNNESCKQVLQILQVSSSFISLTYKVDNGWAFGNFGRVRFGTLEDRFVRFWDNLAKINRI